MALVEASATGRSTVGGDGFLAEVRALWEREPAVFALLGIEREACGSVPGLLASVLAGACGPREQVRTVASDVLARDPGTVDHALADVAATASKNFEPGGPVVTLLTARGVHALLAHRVAHRLWLDGRRDLALSLKTVLGRAFSTDIHPAAKFGPGIWLDHGLGFVAGETVVVEEDVSIWHGVTLGSTFKDTGDRRHPRLARGCTVGAGATILGGIEIGPHAVVAAGAVVLSDVPARTTVAGVPARARDRGPASFGGFGVAPA